MPQIRLSIPDDLYEGMGRYSNVAKSDIMVQALRACVPVDLDQPQRDLRFLAMAQGRIETRIVTQEEIDAAAKEKLQAAERAKAELRERVRLAQERLGVKPDANPEPAPNAEPSPKPKVITDPTGLETLPPMVRPTGGEDPLGMSTPQIAPGEGRRDHA